MTKRIVRFPLRLRDGQEARTLEEVIAFFDPVKITGYFLDGRLAMWLEQRRYSELHEQLAVLHTCERAELPSRLCALFQVPSEVLSGLQLVFSQEELDERLKGIHAAGNPQIHLAGSEFRLTDAFPDVVYIGVNRPQITLLPADPDAFAAKGIVFQDIELPVYHPAPPEAEVQNEGEAAEAGHQKDGKPTAGTGNKVNAGRSLSEAEQEGSPLVTDELLQELESSGYDYTPYYEAGQVRLLKELYAAGLNVDMNKVNKIEAAQNVAARSQTFFMEELGALIQKFLGTGLGKETANTELDMSYDSSFRFHSEREAQEAANNRLRRAYTDAEGFFQSNKSGRITQLLSKKYAEQMVRKLKTFQKETEKLFATHGRKVPQVELKAAPIPSVIGKSSAYLVTLHAGSEQRSDTSIEGDLRDCMEEFLDHRFDYTKHLVPYHHLINRMTHFDITKTKKGLFGETEYKVYNYLLPMAELESSLRECANQFFDAVYQDGVIQRYFQSMQAGFIEAWRSKML
ncbi:hypothetical protein [Paenibacillus sp. y28]|uniref:hypothetical protein n=1 Tax=Paenibacillus sp. y28 TaxID=3129110 RepID=UPI00301B0CC7